MNKTAGEVADFIGSIRARWRAHLLMSFGGFFSAVISVLINQDFWWGLLHYFFGWFYVLYAFTYRHESTVAGIRRLLDFFK